MLTNALLLVSTHANIVTDKQAIVIAIVKVYRAFGAAIVLALGGGIKLKALVAAACACIIAATGYFFIQQYREHRAAVEAAELERQARVCQALAEYKDQFPTPTDDFREPWESKDQSALDRERREIIAELRYAGSIDRSLRENCRGI